MSAEEIRVAKGLRDISYFISTLEEVGPEGVRKEVLESLNGMKYSLDFVVKHNIRLIDENKHLKREIEAYKNEISKYKGVIKEMNDGNITSFE